MCGIVGYLGTKKALPILLNGLKRLEYRGYDSAGIALLDEDQIELIKSQGKVAVLESKLEKTQLTNAQIGIGHTRWATHGVPNDTNAHPHFSNSGNLMLVHNGIIENYETFKSFLISEGFSFNGDTDTEVLVNLIEYVKITYQLSLSEAVSMALKKVTGAYAIAVIDKFSPDEMVIARFGSPLLIGIGKTDGEYFIASDVHPFIEHTNKVTYLEEGHMAIINEYGLTIRDIETDAAVIPETSIVDIELKHIDKEGFPFFMLKEIYQQPTVVQDTLMGRISKFSEQVDFKSIDLHKERFENIERIVILGCGSSYIAGLLGEYVIEDLTRIPTEVEYASEFRYRKPLIRETDLVIVISQSGETADTLAALKLAKEKGAFTYGICNVYESSISRLTDTGAYTKAGSEIGVASTKAMMSQITVLYLIALKIAEIKNSIDKETFKVFRDTLIEMPAHISKCLGMEAFIKDIATKYSNALNCLYLGRKYNYPMALEGALKLKEISYIHAEGYPAAEMKHGPIALIDEDMPIVFIATEKENNDKIQSNIQEVKARGGRLIGIVRKGTHKNHLFDDCIELPDLPDELMPFVTLIPLQLLAYHIAILRGKNVDMPRNLAKSVTVE